MGIYDTILWEHNLGLALLRAETAEHERDQALASYAAAIRETDRLYRIEEAVRAHLSCSENGPPCSCVEALRSALEAK